MADDFAQKFKIDLFEHKLASLESTRKYTISHIESYEVALTEERKELEDLDARIEVVKQLLEEARSG